MTEYMLKFDNDLSRKCSQPLDYSEKRPIYDLMEYNYDISDDFIFFSMGSFSEYPLLNQLYDKIKIEPNQLIDGTFHYFDKKQKLDSILDTVMKKNPDQYDVLRDAIKSAYTYEMEERKKRGKKSTITNPKIELIPFFMVFVEEEKAIYAIKEIIDEKKVKLIPAKSFSTKTKTIEMSTSQCILLPLDYSRKIFFYSLNVLKRVLQQAIHHKNKSTVIYTHLNLPKLEGNHNIDPFLHMSFTKEFIENHPEHYYEDYQELEFMGDAVLDVVLFFYLYKSKHLRILEVFDTITSNEYLISVSLRTKLNQLLFCSFRQQKELTKNDNKIFADMIEAYIGKLFVLKKYEEIHYFVFNHILPMEIVNKLNILESSYPLKNITNSIYQSPYCHIIPPSKANIKKSTAIKIMDKLESLKDHLLQMLDLVFKVNLEKNYIALCCFNFISNELGFEKNECFHLKKEIENLAYFGKLMFSLEVQSKAWSVSENLNTWDSIFKETIVVKNNINEGLVELLYDDCKKNQIRLPKDHLIQSNLTPFFFSLMGAYIVSSQIFPIQVKYLIQQYATRCIELIQFRKR